MKTLFPTTTNGNVSRKNVRSHGFPTFSTWIDDILNDTFTTDMAPGFNRSTSLPAVNIKEAEDTFEVELAVPGMKKSDFNIDLDNDMLTISAEKETSKEDSNDNYTRREFGFRAFKRTFTLPETVNGEAISASYEDGVLVVKLPKRDEAIKKPSRTIQIA